MDLNVAVFRSMLSRMQAVGHAIAHFLGLANLRKLCRLDPTAKDEHRAAVISTA
jgi:hypothetical protein